MKFRLEQLTPIAKADFMMANGLEYDLVGSVERSELKESLLGLCDVITEGMLVNTAYYR